MHDKKRADDGQPILNSLVTFNEATNQEVKDGFVTIPVQPCLYDTNKHAADNDEADSTKDRKDDEPLSTGE